MCLNHYRSQHRKTENDGRKDDDRSEVLDDERHKTKKKLDDVT